MKKLLTVILAAMLVATMFASCAKKTDGTGTDATNPDVAGETKTDKKGDDTIVIGTITPNTGNVSVYGVAVLNAVKLAVEEVNANGGVLDGKKIELDIKDDQGDPNEAVNAFNSLVSDNVKLICGAVTSGCTSAITDAANEEGIVLVAPTSTADAITTEDDYVFRACYSDSFQGAIAAKYASDKGYKDVGVLYCAADTYSKGMYDSFAGACKKYGINIKVTESSSSMDTNEFSNQWASIAKSGVEFVFAPYYYSAVGPYIVPQARKAGYKGIIMGGDGYDGSIGYISEGSDLSAWENVLFTNHYDPAATSDAVVNFVKAYSDKYGETPNAFAALGYDTLYMMVAAIEKAGTADSAAVRDVLADTSIIYNGVTGNFNLDKSGTPVKGSAIIAFTVDGDKVVTKYDSTVESLD